MARVIRAAAVWGAGLMLLAAAAPLPRLLPLPAAMVAGRGDFAVAPGLGIAVPPGDAGARRTADVVAALIGRTCGRAPAVGDAGGIRFRRAPGGGAEAYRLTVAADGVTIAAATDAGLFYGGVTLWQMLGSTPGCAARLPAVTIDDAPRFGWRGMMLDSARHYQSPAFIRALIDGMAASKLNVLHWHLTDDQAWRLEIRRYPRLTAVGGWRTAAAVPPALGERVGGVYTQDEVRALVAYAAARHVTIVPEIDMPGHALAAIRAYPRLGTGVVPPPGIESDWGVFPYLYNVDDATFAFLEDVLTEVMALFPGRMIHVGGDEAVKDQWRASPAVQARMRALGLADEAALQGWFVARIGRFLDAHGRRLIGWDEILDGGVPADATVMSWRGIAGAVAAAAAGHDTVLSPAPVLYLDHRQGDAAGEPPGRATPETLADVYAFDPAPPSIAPAQRRHILGLQANLWTEHVRTEARTAAAAFPRILAVAELGWSPAGTRDFASFADRVVPQLALLATLGLAGSDSAFAPTATVRRDGDAVAVALANQVGSADIRYTTDGSAPAATSPRYARPLRIALPGRLRAAAFADGRALPGGLDRRFDAASVRRAEAPALRRCSDRLGLALEDDAPLGGPRAVFVVDILDPCWRYPAAPLAGMTRIAVEVGQLPFNFQLGADRAKIRFRPPATAAGELEVRADGCDGAPLAVLPLAPAVANPGVTTLEAALPPRTGDHDLCLTFTARGPDPLWAVRSVSLK